MAGSVTQVEKYGAVVWSNTEMDEARKTECLCLRCDNLETREGCPGVWVNTEDGTKVSVPVSKVFYTMCQASHTAFMVTRCPKWKEKK